MDIVGALYREGFQKGVAMGMVIGQIWLVQELLKQEPTPKEELLALPREYRSALLNLLWKQLSPRLD